MAYRINPKKISYRELRTEASVPVAALGWLLLKAGVPLPGSSDLPTVEELEPHRVGRDDVPSAVLEAIEPLGADVELADFRGTLYHRFIDPRHQTETITATYLHRGGRAIGQVVHRSFLANTPPKVKQFVQFITPVGSDGWLVTENDRGDLDSPESLQLEFLPDESVETVWARHQQRLREPGVIDAARRRRERGPRRPAASSRSVRWALGGARDLRAGRFDRQRTGAYRRRRGCKHALASGGAEA